MLFIDYSSAFNTIVPSKLIIKLETLGLNPALCNWVLDFLTGHPQVVRVVNNPLIRGVEMYILYSIPSTPSCLCRSVPSLIHIFLCKYSSSLYTCV
jgi:hypothetical protein